MAINRSSAKDTLWRNRTYGTRVGVMTGLLCLAVFGSSELARVYGSGEVAENYGKAAEGLLAWIASTAPAATATKLVVSGAAAIFAPKVIIDAFTNRAPQQAQYVSLADTASL